MQVHGEAARNSLIARAWRRYERYEGHIGAIALVFGFVVDVLTLQRIDLLFENLVIVFYLTVAGISIALITVYDAGRLRWRPFAWLRIVLPIISQFAFGGLFSGFVVFYSRSAVFGASALFMLALLALLIGNEFFKEYYTRLSFQASIYFTALFFFAIFSVPVVVGEIGAWVFVLSGVVSILVLTFLLYLLARVVPQRVAKNRGRIVASVGSIFALITILYFANIIPPIPLSLKDAGAYHSVARGVDGYHVVTERESRWRVFFLGPTLRVVQGDSVSFYSAVFAPTRLDTNIIHHWQYYDETADEWKTASRISFSISGGRDDGYRGYSVKTAVWPGKWRVDVETPRGARLGRETFTLVLASSTPALIEEVR